MVFITSLFISVINMQSPVQLISNNPLIIKCVTREDRDGDGEVKDFLSWFFYMSSCFSIEYVNKTIETLKIM